jgi:hypothetical protein
MALFADALPILLFATALYYAVEVPARDYLNGIAKCRSQRGLGDAAKAEAARG